MKRGVALGLVFALLVEGSGCATFAPPLMGGACRDSSTGRYISCGSSSSSSESDPTTIIAVVGVAAGLAVIGGLIYLAASSPSPNQPAAGQQGSRVCQDAMGGNVTAWGSQSCEAQGLIEPGDRRSYAGGRVLRCFRPDGMTTGTEAATCTAAGYLDNPPSTETPASATTARGTLRCFTPAGEVVVTQEESCVAAGYLDSMAPATAPAARPPNRRTHTCPNTDGGTIEAPEDEPCAETADARPSRRRWRQERVNTPSYRPDRRSVGGPVHVRGYHRRDGTYVRPHNRAAPRRWRRRR
jgi:hypothetical protein